MARISKTTKTVYFLKAVYTEFYQWLWNKDFLR